jgi:hypothetical protein
MLAVMSASPPPATSVTCTVDGPETRRGASVAAPLGPPPPEVEQAREARDATTLSLLARHADVRVRTAVARNPDAPEEALTALADDPEGVVIAAVSANPKLPDALFVDLYERPRARKNFNLYQSLFSNGARGAYVQSIGGFGRALLYLFGTVFAFFDLMTFAFGVTKGHHRMPPGSPIALQGLCGALVALLLARALAPFERLTVAKLQARAVLPKLAVWCARVAVVTLLALQIHSCATW